jgi:dodecin
MTVCSVSTLTANSPVSFQDALEQGFARANKTLRGIENIEVVREWANIEKGRIKSYEVELKVIFSLE